MLFIVPDDENPQPSAAKKSPAVKVELDLDDAPFLEEAAPEPPKPEPARPEAANSSAQTPAAENLSFAGMFRTRISLFYAAFKAQKKLVALAGSILVLLIALFVALNIFFFNKPDPVTPAPAPAPVAESAPAPAPEPAPEPEYTYTFDPFLVEIRGTEGEIHFLQCSFSIITKNPVLKTEFEVKAVVLRDSLYYYLSNRTLAFLTDPAMAEQRKGDLVNVINEHVSAEKITTLHFQDFLVSRPKP